MTSHSDLFVRACVDTAVAWRKTNLSAMLRPDRLDELRGVLTHAGAVHIADTFLRMAYAPYSGAAVNMALNDAKASELSKWLLAAIVEQLLDERAPGEMLDLAALKSGLVRWIDDGDLGRGSRSDSDLKKISSLIGSAAARITLTAPFAAPIEFAKLAFEGEPGGEHGTND